MGKTRKQRKKKRRRGRGASKRKGGVLLGMRSGFKNVASSVTGQNKASGKKSYLGTALTIALILAALALLFYR